MKTKRTSRFLLKNARLQKQSADCFKFPIDNKYRLEYNGTKAGRKNGLRRNEVLLCHARDYCGNEETLMTENDSILLSTDRITKLYKGIPANREISVDLPRGHIVGFVGENGSGKTTLLRILTGLVRPTSGSFTFHEKNGACRVGAIVESPAFWPGMSASDNLLFQAKLCGADPARIPDVLKTVGLEDTGKKKAKRFSLGMRQRLGIANALLSDPVLLILDEPTNGLDPQGIVELRNLLKELCAERGMTVLVSSHILSELSQLADVFWFIRKGSVLQTLTAAEMLALESKELRFRCDGDAAETMDAIVKNGWADSAVTDPDGWNRLIGPSDFTSILKELSALTITDLSTHDETLESHYMRLMQEKEA